MKLVSTCQHRECTGVGETGHIQKHEEDTNKLKSKNNMK